MAKNFLIVMLFVITLGCKKIVMMILPLTVGREIFTGRASKAKVPQSSIQKIQMFQ